MDQPSNPSKPSKSKQPREGSREWEEARRQEARLKDTNYARNIVLEILRNSPQGKKEAAASLRGWLEKFPELHSLVAQHFDLCTVTEDGWVARLAGANIIAREAIRKEIDNLNREIAGEAPTGLERIFASTVVVAYMGQQLGARIAAEYTSHSEMVAIDRRAESMQRQFLRAVECLTRTRDKTKEAQADPGQGRAANA